MENFITNLTELKFWLSEFRYWLESISALLAFVLFCFKKTRHWAFQAFNWICSKWPYTQIKLLKEENRKLKGDDLEKNHILILQALWVLETKVSITEKSIMEILKCNNQKSKHAIERLEEKKLIRLKGNFEEYELTKYGRNYIVIHGLEISNDQFLEMIK